MRRKPKSLRSRIVVSLLVPVVALTFMWGLDVRDSVTEAVALRGASTTGEQVGHPCAVMLEAMQAERSAAQQFLATGRRDLSVLRGQQAVTDAAVADFRRLSARFDASGTAADIARARIGDLVKGLDTLGPLRARIDSGSVVRAEALSGYNNLIGAAFSVLAAVSSFNDVQTERVMDTVVAIRFAAELLSQEDALLTGATTAGRFGNGQFQQLVKIVGALRFQIPAAGFGLPEDVKSEYQAMLDNPAFSALRAAEDRIVREGKPGGTVPITLQDWKATFDPAAREMQDFVAAGYDEAIRYAREAGDAVLFRLGVAGGSGLLAILLSLLLSFRVGRSVVHRLSLLHAAAIDLAGRRLPEVVTKLRAGEKVDVGAESPPAIPGDDEIAEVGVALGEVHRRAIESAVGEATLRQGMGKVFVNIARRNQSLINRQLEMLAQARATDTEGEDGPAARAEHLAIRMRRQAEHLVILAGSARTRGGVQPVPLAEIIRDAAGEVHGADRIQTRAVADVELPGRMASDLVQVLAELMENAIAFSAPHHPVEVSALRVPSGIAVEIEDRGLGMTPAALEETNGRLAQPPDFDPSNSARLGLVVVAVLAAQRGFQVRLEPSASSGIIATVTIPFELLDEASRPGRTTPVSMSAALSGMHRRPAEPTATPDRNVQNRAAEPVPRPI